MLEYYADPANVQIFRGSGSGNMGDLDWPTAGTEKGRFWLPNQPYVLSFIRVHFAGAAGTANLGINVDSAAGEDHDMLLHTVRLRGTGVDVKWGVPPWEIKNWRFELEDVVVLTWANPDSGNISWGATVGLIPIKSNA